jgi:hypothetical protein
MPTEDKTAPLTAEGIRLECLKVAVRSSPSNLQEALSRAGQFVEFVNQRSEEKGQ